MQVAILYCVTQGLFDTVTVDEVKQFEQTLIDHLEKKYPKLLAELIKEGDVPETTFDKIVTATRDVLPQPKSSEVNSSEVAKEEGKGSDGAKEEK